MKYLTDCSPGTVGGTGFLSWMNRTLLGTRSRLNRKNLPVPQEFLGNFPGICNQVITYQKILLVFTGKVTQIGSVTCYYLWWLKFGRNWCTEVAYYWWQDVVIQWFCWYYNYPLFGISIELVSWYSCNSISCFFW